jgi:hypothetical protein
MNQELFKQAKQQTKDLILELIKTQKPQNTTQLITLTQQKTGYTQEQIQGLLVELENEEKLSFTKKQNNLPPTTKAFISSTNSTWYWITIALATATSISGFTISENAFPLLVYLRLSLGAIFMLFLPGYALIKVLFPINVQIKTNNRSLDTIERIALSIGMSLVLVPMVGLILNYTPWGINLTSITLSLYSLTIIFATAASIREYVRAN